MARSCEKCKYDATIFYVWLVGSDDHVCSYCKRCWASEAKRSGGLVSVFTQDDIDSYTAFMDSGYTKVFYSLEEVQLYQIKRQL